MEELPYYEDDQVVEQYGDRARDGLHPNEEFIIDNYFPDREATVLDLGCGTGRTTAPLDERGFDVIGVDLTEPFIERAREEFPDLKFRVGDATDLPFSDRSFECVLFAGLGIDDIPTRAERMWALLEIWRVLEPGGVVAFDARNFYNRFIFDPRSVEEWTRQFRFLVRNLRAGSLLSRHALIEFPHGVDIAHAISPTAQRRQLEDIGFDVVDVLTRNRDRWPIHLEARPFFVAKKPV